MWAQALEFLARADTMHRQYFRVSASERALAQWEPPVNVFEDEREILIVVALPGVSANSIEVAVEPGLLVVRAQSAPPFSGLRCAVHRLEIPYGRFERRITLPSGPLELAAHEVVDGCLALRLSRLR